MNPCFVEKRQRADTIPFGLISEEEALVPLDCFGYLSSVT
jgi:hypothetical protein